MQRGTAPTRYATPPFRLTSNILDHERRAVLEEPLR